MEQDPDYICCRDGYVMNAANAPINAHVFAAHAKLAWLAADWVDRAPHNTTTNYENIALQKNPTRFVTMIYMPSTLCVWEAPQATELGKGEEEAARFALTAASLKQGIMAHLARPTSSCQPAVGPCFADGLNTSHTSVQSTMYVLGSGVLTPAEAQPYLPFLVAKSTPFPRCSAALSVRPPSMLES